MHSDSDSIADEYTLLGKLFVLAEKSKEVILAALVARAKESALSNSTIYYPAIYTVQIIYEGTTEGSPACDLMVDLYTVVKDNTLLFTSHMVPTLLLEEQSAIIHKVSRPLFYRAFREVTPALHRQLSQ